MLFTWSVRESHKVKGEIAKSMITTHDSHERSEHEFLRNTKRWCQYEEVLFTATSDDGKKHVRYKNAQRTDQLIVTGVTKLVEKSGNGSLAGTMTTARYYLSSPAVLIEIYLG